MTSVCYVYDVVCSTVLSLSCKIDDAVSDDMKKQPQAVDDASSLVILLLIFFYEMLSVVFGDISMLLFVMTREC